MVEGYYGGIVRKAWGDMMMTFWERSSVTDSASDRFEALMEEVWMDQGRRDERKKGRDRFCSATGLEAYPILPQLHQDKKDPFGN